MVMQKKNVGLYVLLTILTCGLFGLYWMYCLHEETNVMTETTGEPDPILVILLNIITCGIYGMYWCYREGEKLQNGFIRRGIPCNENLAAMYLILSICNYFTGFTKIIAHALIQDKLNTLIDASGMSGQFMNTDHFESTGSTKSNDRVVVIGDDYTYGGTEESQDESGTEE